MLFPLMEVRSAITGIRGVSLPFSDYCEPLFSDCNEYGDAVNHLLAYGKRHGWKSVELRGGIGCSPKLLPVSDFYRHTLDISLSETELYNRLRDSTRRNIRKSLREGVAVRISNQTQDMAAYYRLHCLTRKRHGMPPQPYRFFNLFQKYLVQKGLGFIVLAEAGGRTAAGAVFLQFGREAIYKFGASNPSFQHLRTNNLVMWEGIRRCRSMGATEFSFGRTEIDNVGLLQFKSGWGAVQETLRYYKANPKGLPAADVTEKRDSLMNGKANRMMSRLPVPALRLIGRAAYRHLG